jgi:hypothetical protein
MNIYVRKVHTHFLPMTFAGFMGSLSRRENQNMISRSPAFPQPAIAYTFLVKSHVTAKMKTLIPISQNTTPSFRYLKGCLIKLIIKEYRLRECRSRSWKLGVK